MKTIRNKIFLRLLFVIVVVLGVSMFLNIKAQRNLYIDYARESYMGFEQGMDLQKLLGLGENNRRLSYDEAVDCIYDFNVKEKIGISHWPSRNIIAFIGSDYQKQYDQNEIIDYTFYSLYQDNYIYLMTHELGYKNFSIEHMPKEKRESLLSYLKSNMNREDGYGDISTYVDYCLEEENLVYIKWGNDEYGEKTNSVSSAYINNFCINGQLCWYDRLNEKNIIINVEDLFKVLKTKTYSNNGSFGGVTIEEISYKDNNYFISKVFIGGGRPGIEPLVNGFLINIVEDFDMFIIRKHFEQNLWLYVIAVVLLVFVSYKISNMISKPIKQIEQVALKISNNEFDEEVKIKSNDEIGSLAHSIDTMRLNLKDTINKLNEEIEKVKELESLRKDFINQFTHEMKTPLGIINGYSELIEETDNEEEKQRYLDIINKETVRINDLIQSMLKLSRLEAGKVELNIEELDLEDIITEVIDEYEVLLMKKNIKVDVNVINKNINGDKNQLITVIRNFLSNAIKHTDTKIIITIDNGVSVYNEGLTIEEEKLESIWYTFVTHDKTGTGLGLAICRSILELHHYHYGVTNKEDGVEFHFHE